MQQVSTVPKNVSDYVDGLVKNVEENKKYFDSHEEERTLLGVINIFFPDTAKKLSVYNSCKNKWKSNNEVKAVEILVNMIKFHIVEAEKNVRDLPESKDTNFIVKNIAGMSCNYVNIKKTVLETINKVKKFNETVGKLPLPEEANEDELKRQIQESEGYLKGVLPSLKIYRTAAKNYIDQASKLFGRIVDKVDAEKRLQTAKRRVGNPFKNVSFKEASDKIINVVKEYLNKDITRLVKLQTMCTGVSLVYGKDTDEAKSRRESFNEGHKAMCALFPTDANGVPSDKSALKAGPDDTKKLIEKIETQAKEHYPAVIAGYTLFMLGALAKGYEAMAAYCTVYAQIITELCTSFLPCLTMITEASSWEHAKEFFIRALSMAAQLGCYAGALAAVSGCPVVGLVFAILPVAGWLYNLLK